MTPCTRCGDVTACAHKPVADARLARALRDQWYVPDAVVAVRDGVVVVEAL